MVTDLIPIRTTTRKTGVVRRSPDVAVAAIPLFQRLRETLQAASRFQSNIRQSDARGSRIWKEPPLFFFDSLTRSDSTPPRTTTTRFPWKRTASPHERDPVGAAAWAALPNLLDDALTVLGSSVEARHAARAIPGLREAAQPLVADHPRIRQFADVLAVLDDAVLVVVHPEAQIGVRVLVQGIADVGQFHILLANELLGSPMDGRMAGPRPDPRQVAACQDESAGPDLMAEAWFQLYQAAVLEQPALASNPSPSHPDGFMGVEHWLWPQDTLASIPRVQGERLLILGEPVYPIVWPVARRVPLVRGSLTVLERFTPAQVARWLEARTGRSSPVPEQRRAA